MKILDVLLGRVGRRDAVAGAGPLRGVGHSALPAVFDVPRRTEDIRFSPSGRVLAAVATNGQLLLFAVEASRRPVVVSRTAMVSSPVLLSPHGIDFLEEDLVVVANRTGWVTFFRLPPVDAWQAEMSLEPVHEMHSRWFGAKGETRKLGKRTIVCGPGSVRVRGDQLLVACNKSGTLTTHSFALRDGKIETGEGELLAQAELGLPDGLAVSRCGRWIAASDHSGQCVAVIRTSDHARCATLRDPALGYPHGLCFSPDGQTIYTADAGGRGLHIFTAPDGWSESATFTSRALTAVDEDAFRKTHASTGKEFRALEGGIKGIDLAPDGRLIATTCQNQVLRFFEIVP